MADKPKRIAPRLKAFFPVVERSARRGAVVRVPEAVA